MSDSRTDASPAQRRGFCVAPDDPTLRRYAIPTALLRGAAAMRAVEAGAAQWLAGGPLAFAGITLAERRPGQTGHRKYIGPSLQPLTLSLSLKGRGNAVAGAFEHSMQRVVDRSIEERMGGVPSPLEGEGQGEGSTGVSTLLNALSAPRQPWAGFDLKRPLIMGIVNVTPDSFSDGGDFAEAKSAVARGVQMAEQGADILDIGGESTRPGAAPVSLEAELDRVIPVIRNLAERGLCVSVDTRHAKVMGAAAEAGARIINDVTALTGDPHSLKVAANSGADIVLMHMQGEPRTMQADPQYADATLDLIDYFGDRLAALAALGVPAAKISLDPGIGFGKKDPHNLLILGELAAFQVFGCAVTLGVSRKSFIGRLSRGEAPKERMAGSLAVATLGFDQGVQILRVHDVAETYQARAMWQVMGGQP